MKRFLDVLPFEMFDNIFVGSSAVFPNRPGPVEHKTKGGYETTKWKRKYKPRPKLRRESRETKEEMLVVESAVEWKKSRIIAVRTRLIKNPRLVSSTRRRDSTLAERTRNEESLMSLIKKEMSARRE